MTVVDIRREILALGGEWHIDANAKLIEEGSDQKDLWGFNLYPKERGESALEYTSLINIRPSQGNRTIEIEDEQIREKMLYVIQKLVLELGI